MKPFFCDCGHRVFFDNTECVSCGRVLGFDPEPLALLALAASRDPAVLIARGQAFRHCRNRIEYQACNWLVPADDPGAYCESCRRTLVIPSLEVPANLGRWQRLEQAKRRLLYTLRSLGLPLDPVEGLLGLRFRFLEDQRTNPRVPDAFVTTGHDAGVITINAAEADDARRAVVREEMQERYRTLLGHFRHESGHFYFGYLVGDEALEEFRSLFGDERSDYAQALEAYYALGPAADWPVRWVSAYASAHPLEDWAESFAHYLHIIDALETAHSFGVTDQVVSGVPAADWIGEWAELAVALNELNRSLGVDDPYPFVLPASVVGRLAFIHQRVERAVRQSPPADRVSPRTPS